MNHLDQLENKSIHILREAYSEFKNLGMLKGHNLQSFLNYKFLLRTL